MSQGASRHSKVRLACFAVLVLAYLMASSGSVAAESLSIVSVGVTADEARWKWPVDGERRVVEAFRAPAHAYGAGHRGMDVAVTSGGTVQAPAAGVVAFRGRVVDRPLLTIEHAPGLVSTFEPLDSDLRVGDRVEAGTVIGQAATGGHAIAGTLHIGVRVDGEYVNPLPLFEDIPRAVLLPCCA